MMQVTFLQDQVQGMEKTEEEWWRELELQAPTRYTDKPVATKWTAEGYPIVTLDLSDAVLLWTVKSHAVFS